MSRKGIQVQQPDFSEWIIEQRRQLNLSTVELKQKINYKISDRTLKYLEGGKKESFSEFTLIALAEGLDISYPNLLAKIESMKSSLPSFFSPFVRHRMRTRLILVISPLILVIMSAVIFFYHTKKQQINQVVDIRIDSDYPDRIIGFNRRGEKIWQQILGTPVKKAECADIDGDGQHEILAGTWKSSSIFGGEKAGHFFIFDEYGKKILQQNLWTPSIYPVEEHEANIADFVIANLDADDHLEIIIAIRGVEYYPSRIAVFEYDKDQLIETHTYWNPGYVLQLGVEDMNNDDIPEIICIAVNNDFKRCPEFDLDDNVYCIFMLNSRDIAGQAPPHLGRADKGRELWYQYVTPTSRDSESQIVGLTTIGEDNKIIRLKFRNTCFFSLNYNGEIIDRFIGDHCTGNVQLHRIHNTR